MLDVKFSNLLGDVVANRLEAIFVSYEWHAISFALEIYPVDGSTNCDGLLFGSNVLENSFFSPLDSVAGFEAKNLYYLT